MNLTEKDIKEIASELDIGMICFYHPPTGEIESYPDPDDILFEPEPWQEIMDKIDNDFDNYVRFEKMSSRQGYGVMEDFALSLNDENFKKKCLNLLQRRKPFHNFKDLVEFSDYREDWFAFKNQASIDWVKKQMEMNTEDEDVINSTDSVDVMDLKETRHHLHQNPEVSGDEKNTSQFVREKLEEIGVKKIHHGFSLNSILAEIDFEKPGKTILFRCELDALPIQETNDLNYKSKNEGVGHKCGHDGHMTMLLGLAEKMIQKKFSKGKVLFLFQSAEEDGRGAKGILDSKILEDFAIDFVFSLHNVPGFKMGNIVCKTGSFTPSVESLDVKLIGKTSHAGMPEKGVNPAMAISKLIQYYQNLHQPDKNNKGYFLATPIRLKMGKPAYGTSAGEAQVSYTFRSYDHNFFVQQKKDIENQTKKIVKETEGLNCKLMWKEGFEANQNNEKAYGFIKKAAAENDLKFIQKEYPFSWGEDFGAFTQHYRGAMFGLGSGENQPELHNPDYDFPDELLDKGILMFYSLAKMTL